MNGNTGAIENDSLQRERYPTDDSVLDRRDCIPEIRVRGTHYDVGFDIGRTFMSLIQTTVINSKLLNENFIPLYKTEKGRKVYDETLQAVRTSYPQYVRELEGMADGSYVPFYKLFLLNLDDILPNVVGSTSTDYSQGCSTLSLNKGDQVLIGHNEDGFAEYISNVFVAHVHITEVEPNEIFTAFVYAGLLPGYAMGFNPNLAFSINIIGAKHLASGKIPRTFATRAILGADSLEKIEYILQYNNGGVGDALSVNLAMLKKNALPTLYNIEASPSYPASNEAAISIIEVESGQEVFHCNKFLQLHIPEEKGPLIITSDKRQETKDRLPIPENKQDVINILGDHSQKHYNIFRNEVDEQVVTLAVGMFDFVNRTWSLYTKNPKTHDPIAVFPLYETP